MFCNRKFAYTNSYQVLKPRSQVLTKPSRAIFGRLLEEMGPFCYLCAYVKTISSAAVVVVLGFESSSAFASASAPVPARVAATAFASASAHTRALKRVCSRLAALRKKTSVC